MIDTNSLIKKIAKLSGAVAVSVVLSACASIPQANNGTPPTQAEDCKEDCTGEDGVGRYQYYLGILSVFLIG